MIKPEFPIFELEDHNISKSGAKTEEASQLYHMGILSFNPLGKTEFPRADIEELAFLKKIYYDSGLDSKAVLAMLAKLEKPYRYSFDNIFWDFGSKEWKEVKLS